MHTSPSALLVVAAAVLFGWTPASAKRLAPKPVPPVVWQGVEYRAPLDVEHMGCVQAFEVASGKKLWETKVYPVHISDELETDIQWVFISGLQVHDGKLWVTHESGNWSRLDLVTGRVEARDLKAVTSPERRWWYVGGSALCILAIYFWLRAPRSRPTLPPSVS